MQIKTTVKSHLTLTGMVIIKKSRSNKYRQEEKKESLCTAGG